MARKKNLTQEDLEDIQVWEDHSQRIEYKGTPEFKRKKIEVKCLNAKQKDLKKSIENNEITIAIGPAGCLINSEKIKIYKLKE
jgi:phosphate starvation-inducible protein PhoH